ncbi:hypothetical protein RhiirB3_393782 [Rhizophagus irregularis]|nr:hypothetical protein RhiirB3_393782 [Rhizophagus irregularis]
MTIPFQASIEGGPQHVEWFQRIVGINFNILERSCQSHVLLKPSRSMTIPFQASTEEGPQILWDVIEINKVDVYFPGFPGYLVWSPGKIFEEQTMFRNGVLKQYLMETSQKDLCAKNTTPKEPQGGSKAIVRLYQFTNF